LLGHSFPTRRSSDLTGEVFLFYMLSLQLPENTTCSGDSGELSLVSSIDGGLTWGEPRSLAGLFDHFPYEWALHGPGPGHGIQLDTGRLLLNCSHRRVIVGNSVGERYYGVAPIHSDDHGASWQTTGEIPVSTDYPINEARLVQRSDGTVLINGRPAAGGNRHRIVSVSADRGLTWCAPALDGGTGTSNAVDASLLRYSGGPAGGPAGGPDRVLFSRPDAPVRTNMTVSVSYDEAHSFRYSRVVNEARSYYSDLARLSDGTIVLVYGCDGDIPSFPRRVNVCRFSLDWLTGGRDSLKRGPGLSEQRIDLAGVPPVVAGGALAVVPDPLARGGARAVLTPDTPSGAYLEYAVEVPSAGAYELLLRYHRPAAGGLVGISVDGAAPPRTAVIDTTQEHAEGYDVAHLGSLELAQGRHTVRVALAGPGRGGGSLIALDTLSLLTAPAGPDLRNEVLVDNDDAGYQVLGGTWSAATGVPGYYGGNYRTAPAGAGDHQVRWEPVVPHDGRYEIQVSYTPHENRASNAPYAVTHAGGTETVRIDQRAPGSVEPRGGTWASLGRYDLLAGRSTAIHLTNAADGYVVADALRLVRT
jgi:hypothetical protein